MITDINVCFGHWPFQKFPYTTLKELNRKLSEEDISKALVSSIDAVLYPDPDWGNISLLPRLASFSNLLPVGVINPSLSNWRESIERCLHWGAEAVKIFPNYHNYSLSSPVMERMMDYLAGRKIHLMVQIRLEDERSQHPLFEIPGVEPGEIIKLAGRFPEITVLALCPYFKEAIDLVCSSSNIHVDISFTETLNTVSALLEEIPATRILFGSHSPFLYTRSASMKIKAPDIPQKDFKAIAYGNAQALLNLSQRRSE